MTTGSRKDYLRRQQVRYIKATKKGKSAILDDFCGVYECTRKHAIKLLNGPAPEYRERPGPKEKYGAKVQLYLVMFWKMMRGMCSKRMVAALPVWTPYLQDPEFDDETRRLLCEMSPSTIDRLLRKHRQGAQKGLSATKAGSLVKSSIPIELLHSRVKKPGFIEADTVVHCGDTLLGEHANTLTLTDLFSGWTENRALWNKPSEQIIRELITVRAALPFRMKGFACDNGSEFINHSLVKYLRGKNPDTVKFTRRRPYKKNDAAHVEQKNDSHVRKLFGYNRIDRADFIPLMNEIYEHYWNPLQNYFCPVMKLVEKVRVGGKIRKKYDTPKSPFQRLMESDDVTEKQKEALRLNYEALDPIRLKEELDAKLAAFDEQLRRHIESNITKGEGGAA